MEEEFDNFEEDFEGEVEEQVYDDNYERELAEMMKQQELKIEEKTRYQRPTLNLQDFQLDKDFYIMQIDCDYYIRDRNPIVRMFGVTNKGNSVLLHVSGFVSYFYVEAPIGLNFNPQNLEVLKNELNKRAGFNQNNNNNQQQNNNNNQQQQQQNQNNNNQPQRQQNQQQSFQQQNQEQHVTKIEIVYKESLKEYKGKDYKKQPFLRIFTQQPSFVAKLRGMFEKGIQLCGFQFNSRTFESNMPFALRFMIDKDIVGMGWVKVNGNLFKIREEKQCVSRCQIEVDVDERNIEAMKPEGEWGQIAPIRLLSFDIECAAQRGFPTANKDPIIQIASVVKMHNQQEDLVRMVLTLDECANIPGAIVKCFKKEGDMLKEWERFVQTTDPDLFIGYNITNFDLPYIINRAQALKVSGFGQLGKLKGIITKIRNGKYNSKQMGMRETKEMNFEGRIQLDMMIHMHREQKLSSYSLNNVSALFLKEQKEDVHHSMIYELQHGNPETRKRLAVYCLKDAQLPLKLMEKLMCIYNYAEMARVTGVPLNFLFIRGQQIKVASQLYRKAKQVDYVIPTERSGKSDGKFEGADVLDPMSGYYKEPIATLDFASLYPSIMMAHNLCYSTLITNSKVRNSLVFNEDYICTPHGAYFITDKLRKGLLPQILEELINARKKARKELATETDPVKKAVLDGRQLAIKISANSVYGFTGAQVGQLPCLDISTSVTKFGKQMIQHTRDMVLKNFTKEKGYGQDAVVIYGDTDSVMVKFGVKTVEEAMKLGKEAAELISKEFKAPIKLEFEKIYFPYLLMSKKRYAGVYWTKPEKYDKIDTKGIENVRRDNCPLIRNLINTCLKYLLVDMDEKAATEHIKGIVSDLYQNKVDISQLVITKALSKGNDDEEEENNKDGSKQNDKNKKPANNNNYKVKMAHVELAKKMQKRDDQDAPHIGDRIPYIMIAGAKGSKNYENAEDPIVVLEKGLPIDFDYYIQKQLKQPLVRLFEHVLPDPEALFYGEHTKVRYIPKGESSALGKFLVITKTCLHCKIAVKNNEAVCQNCASKNKAVEIYTEKIINHNLLAKEFHEAWTQCQRCQGSLHDQVICANRDCPIFYKRQKLKKDLISSQEVLDRFENDW